MFRCGLATVGGLSTVCSLLPPDWMQMLATHIENFSSALLFTTWTFRLNEKTRSSITQTFSPVLFFCSVILGPRLFSYFSSLATSSFNTKSCFSSTIRSFCGSTYAAGTRQTDDFLTSCAAGCFIL
jgi:hypothetical protein